MKENEEEEKFLIDEHLCADAHHGYYCNLIQEESETMQKEANENAENLKSQVIEAKNRCNALVEKHDELHAQLMEGAGHAEEDMIKTEKLECENEALQEESENIRQIFHWHN